MMNAPPPDAETVIGPSYVLVTLKVAVVLEPTLTLPKLREDGETATDGLGALPLPDRLADRPPPPVNVAVPV